MSNSKVDFYYFLASPPCRAVMLLAKTVGLEMNNKVVNIMAGEQMTPIYLRLNPQHTVPTVVDNGLILTESRAILKYLADRYGKDESLTPKDAKRAALVNQRLYFDACTLFPRLAQYMMPVITQGSPPNEENLEKLEEALGYLDGFLENQAWAAGDQMTIADFALIATVSTAEAVNVDVYKFPSVNVWFEKAKSVVEGYDEINRAGCSIISGAFNSRLKQ